MKAKKIGRGSGVDSARRVDGKVAEKHPSGAKARSDRTWVVAGAKAPAYQAQVENGTIVSQVSNSVQSPLFKTAKLFRNGRSQAVRLPKEFRFEGNHVAIRRDEATGEVVLAPNVKSMTQTLRSKQTRRKLSLQELFAIFDQAQFPAEFFQREVHVPRELDLFS